MLRKLSKDGHIINQNLLQNKLSFDWLYEELRGLGVEKISDVFYASLNTDGTLYVDLKEDKLEYVQKIED